VFGNRLLMVSRIPTPALAGFHVSQRMRMPMLAVIGIAAGAIVDLLGRCRFLSVWSIC